MHWRVEGRSIIGSAEGHRAPTLQRTWRRAGQVKIDVGSVIVIHLRGARAVLPIRSRYVYLISSGRYLEGEATLRVGCSRYSTRVHRCAANDLASRACNPAGDLSFPSMESGIVIVNRELIGGIGHVRVETGRVRLHADGVRAGVKGNDTQPSVAAVGQGLIIGKH